MAITYVASMSNPADNATYTANPAVLLNPHTALGLQAGDLVIMVALTRTAGTTPVVTTTGGQTWNALNVHTTATRTVRAFWCRYNGTMTGDRFTVTVGGTLCNIIVAHSFRPTNAANTWDVDVAQITGTDAATPAEIPSLTSIAASTVAFACWHTEDDNTWSAPTGTGWVTTGLAQYRNTSGNDASMSFAHNIQTSAGATGAVSKTQPAMGYDIAGYLHVIFKEIGSGPVTHEVAMTETVSLSSDFGRTKTTGAAMVENISLAETDARTKRTGAAMTETISLAESESRTKSTGGAITDSISLVDTQGRTITANKAITESVSFSDILAVQWTANVSMIENISIADSMNRGKIVEASMIETLNLSDTQSKVAQFQALAPEAITIINQMIAGKRTEVNVAEVIVFSDQIIAGLAMVASMTETLILANSMTAVVGQDVNIEEAISFVATMAANANLGANIAENVSFSVIQSAVATLHAALIDSIVLMDMMSAELSKPRPQVEMIAYILKNPQAVMTPSDAGIDAAIKELQARLAVLPWLEKSFGRAWNIPSELLGKKKLEPMVYQGSKEYYTVLASDTLKSYSFWRVRGRRNLVDPSEVTNHGTFFMSDPADVIVWFNMQKIDPSKNYVFKEELIRDVMKLLDGSTNFKPLGVYDDKAEEIFSGYTLNQTHRDLLMYPYGAFRIEGTLKYSFKC